MTVSGAVVHVDQLKRDADRFRQFGKDGAQLAVLANVLLFFKWAIETGVVDYVFKNVEAIEADMAEMRRKKKLAKLSPSGRGRTRGGRGRAGPLREPVYFRKRFDSEETGEDVAIYVSGGSVLTEPQREDLAPPSRSSSSSRASPR